MIGAAQIRAARALLGIRQLELSKIADVGISTVKRLELASEISGSAGTSGNSRRPLRRRGWPSFTPTSTWGQVSG